MLQAILCDDDEQVLAQYRPMLEALAQKHRLELAVRCFSSAGAMLFALEDGQAPDLLYLDVQMPGESGIDAAKKLRAAGCRAQIIFLTNSRESVFESFDAYPLQYLIKGEFSDAKFEQVFLHAAKLAGRDAGERFECVRGAERLAIPIRQIRYFEVSKRIVTVHYEEGSYEFYGKMEDLEARLLEKGFVRTHRSFLVNVACIRRLGQEELELTGGRRVPLGRTHARQVKETLSRFLASGGMVR